LDYLHTVFCWLRNRDISSIADENPYGSGLVPTLVETGVENPRNVSESLVTVEFVDALSGATGKDRLVPEDLYEAARARVWADRVNRECCSPYYTILVRTEDQDRRAGYDALLTGLRAFSEELSKTPGPTFLAGEQLSTVDIALIPWAYRFYVFDTYRGPTYTLPRDDPTLKHYWQWFDHVMNLPQVISPQYFTQGCFSSESGLLHTNLSVQLPKFLNTR